VIRFLLLLLFFVMFAGDSLGMDISWTPGLSIKNVLLYLLFLWIAAKTVVVRDRKAEGLLVIVPFSVLLLYSIYSWLVVVFIVDYSNYNAVASGFLLKSGLADPLFMLLVFFFGAANTRDCVWLLRMVVWLVMLGNILTFADAFQLPDLQMLRLDGEGRVNGFLGQPNEYGAFLALFFPATVAVFVSESGIRRIVAAIGVLATFLCLLLTFSRGAYVGVALGLLGGTIFLRNYVSVLAVTRIAIAMAIVIAIAIPLLFVAGYENLIVDRISLLSGSVDTVTTGRSTLWLRALSVMREEPVSFLTGFGWNAYDSFEEFRFSIHNSYLNYLFNLGLIGLTLFLTTLLAVLITLRRGIVSASGVAKSFLVAATLGATSICVTMFFAEIYTAGLLMWAFVGLALRLAIAAHGKDELTARPIEIDKTGLAEVR